MTDTMTEKTLNNTDLNGTSKNVPDVEVFGDDVWKLISKASSKKEGWMKSTKALHIKDRGCLVQVTTQQRNVDGTYSLAEALTFVPGVMIKTFCDDYGVLLKRELVEDEF